MIGLLGRQRPAATLRQQCPQMTPRRCSYFSHPFLSFSQLKICVTIIILLALISPPAASFGGMRRRTARTIYDNHSLFPVTLPPLPLPDTGYDTVDELAEEYVERPIDRLRSALH